MSANAAGRGAPLLKRFGLPALLIALALLFPFLDDGLGLGLMFPVIVIAVYVMLALGLNIVVGFAGLLDLGFVAFYALGAYVMGWLASGHFNQVSFSFLSTAKSLSGGSPPGIHLSFWIVLVLAGAFTALCGIIIGAPTLRLRGIIWRSSRWGSERSSRASSRMGTISAVSTLRTGPSASSRSTRPASRSCRTR